MPDRRRRHRRRAEPQTPPARAEASRAPGRRRGAARHPRHGRGASKSARSRRSPNSPRTRTCASTTRAWRTRPRTSPRRRSATWARSAATSASTRAARTTKPDVLLARGARLLSQKDGTRCHVVPQGKRCVAARTRPTSRPVDRARRAGRDRHARGRRRRDAPRPAGHASSSATACATTCSARRARDARARADVVARPAHGVPQTAPARAAIDFPMLSVAVAAPGSSNVAALRVVVARSAQPRTLGGLDAIAVGKLYDAARSPEAVGAVAFKTVPSRCRTSPTTPTGGTTWCPCS